MRPSHHDCAFVFLLTKWYCGEVDRTFGQHRETSAKESTPHVIMRATVYGWKTMRFVNSSATFFHHHSHLFCKKNIHVKRYMKNDEIEKK